MAKIIGIVQIKVRGVDQKITLDSSGAWQAHDVKFAHTLQSNYGLDRFGPQDGFPINTALSAVAKDFNGKVIKEPPIPKSEEEVIY